MTARVALELLRSSSLASVFALCAIGALFSTHAIRQFMGDAGHGAVMTGLCALGAAMLFARHREIRAIEIMPVMLLALLVWLLVSVMWTRSIPATLVGWMQLAVPTFLAIVVAQFRDTLQTVRATGDVLRFLLTGSLALEIVSGILLDGPVRFLGIAGNLADGGPIQGLFGSRTVLGVVTMMGLITFLVEWRTRSVRPGLSLYSVALAGLLAVFTASPLVLGMALTAGAATGALAVVRRVAPPVRSGLQPALAVAVAVALVCAYIFRRPLIYWLNAEPDFLTRSRLWNAILDLAAARPVHGWGWVGTWPDALTPYSFIRLATGHHHDSALNAWMDVLLQAGTVGVVLLLAFAGLALARAWVTASERRSTVHVWPPLIIITVLADSVVTSSPLGGFGWFLLVVCATRASLLRGWRRGWEERGSRSPDAGDSTLPSGGL